jgi:hypothetical protein
MTNELRVAVVTAILTIVGSLITYLYQRWDDHTTINRALLTEISRLLAVIDSHYRWWRKCIDDKKTNQPLLPFTTDIYDKSIENIGALNRDYASLIVGFYGYVRFLNHLQNARYDYRELPKEFIKNYTRALEELLSRYGTEFSKAFRHYHIKQPSLESLPMLYTSTKYQ